VSSTVMCQNSSDVCTYACEFALDGRSPMIRWIGSVLARSLLLGALVLISACSPRFNWRDVRSEDGFVALFPARTERDSRTVLLGHESANMTLTGAEVDHITFAIGVANFSDRANLDQARVDYENSLLANFKGATPSRSTVETALVGSKASINAEQLTLADAKLSVVARFAVRSNRIVEILVAAPVTIANDPKVKEARDMFFDSVQLF
jgi:hypothetical protein